MSTRYFVYSKNAFQRTGQFKSLKNAATREEARQYRRERSVNAGTYGIYDRATGRIS